MSRFLRMTGRVALGGLLVCCLSAVLHAQTFLITSPASSEGTVPSTPELLSPPAPSVLPESLPDEWFKESKKEPTVVSAATQPLPQSAVASSVTVITAEEIALRQARSLLDALQGVPGLDVVPSGGPGQLATVFIRGAASERTVVLYNGVPLNDPVSPARNADLSRISLDNVDRIEIARGSQSAVFGSGALGGVINVITKDAAPEWSGSLDAEGGAYSTWRGSLTAGGRVSGLGVSVGASLENTQGYSSAAADAPQDAVDADGHRALSLDAGISATPASNLDVTLSNRFLRAETEMDSFGGTAGDDPNAVGSYWQSVHQATVSWNTLPGTWSQEVGLGFNQSSRHYDNPVDPAHPQDAWTSDFRARLLTAAWKHCLEAPAHNRISAGANVQQESGAYEDRSQYLDWWTGEPTEMRTEFRERRAQLTGVFLEDCFSYENWDTTVGARLDRHEQFGEFITYRLTQGYRVPATLSRLRLTYGTGFNAPTLYQLYADDAYTQGNRALRPETSRGWEIGAAQDLPAGWGELQVTYFQSDYSDEIVGLYDLDLFRYRYLNRAQAEMRGWESEARFRLLDSWRIAANYTRLWTREWEDRPADSRPLLRRADYQASLDVSGEAAGVKWFGQVLHIGPRLDVGDVRLAPYTLLNVAASAEVWPGTSVHCKVNNLLNARYEAITGYGTSGVAAYLGCQVAWKLAPPAGSQAAPAQPVQSGQPGQARPYAALVVE
ncbi:MAG: TonB-dependent receptor [candidate division FCPU426 bacterium]